MRGTNTKREAFITRCDYLGDYNGKKENASEFSSFHKFQVCRYNICDPMTSNSIWEYS